MKRPRIVGLLLFALSALSLYAGPINLGTASSFAVLGASTVTNTGNTVLWGNLGLSPGSAVTGFYPPGTVHGTIYAGDPPPALATLARADALAAYNMLADKAPTGGNLTGQDLGLLTLTPGVYKFDSSAGLTGALTLNLLGDPNALFVFQIGKTLTTAPNSSVTTINGTDCCNVFWLIGSSATLDTNTAFRGNILAQTSITMLDGATITDGRALVFGTGAVTLHNNVITNVVCDTLNGEGVIPEPGTVPLLGAGLVGLILFCRRPRKRSA